MKILFVSLGCDKNLVDSEKMLALLSKSGYEFTDDEQEADVVVINTCSFISDAKEESIQTILEMSELKKTARLKCLIITGCLSQRYREEIATELPEVDGMLGIASWDKIVELVDRTLAGQKPQIYDDLSENANVSLRAGVDRVLTGGGHYAYLKIAEGCNKHCTYCAIPSIRGRYHSIPMEELVREAQMLSERGVKEIILVAQETTLYGLDLYKKKCLPELIDRISQIDGIYWIRIQYCYPEEITDELIMTIRDNPKVCHYLDLPIQHSSDRILKLMNRATNQAELREKIAKLREEIPDIALRTTLIAGFPGETEDDHEDVMDFIDELEFDRLGAFTYSPEEGTPAADMDGQVDEDVKKRWKNDIMELQQEITADKAADRVGSTVLAVIEGYLRRENCYVGRTYMDAPGVDGYIFISTLTELNSGDFVKVRVTGAQEYDLIGELEDEFTE
ncbi:MAG: 30S ribosomal protein S12 methylthiotransferase RimO [Lachnospiraceae bacterium]|nr:30S ribosomal protein S12 methylthiotransferase RimO [Lachnospiraceae bacterium]